jgi:hypothetical protein
MSDFCPLRDTTKQRVCSGQTKLPRKKFSAILLMENFVQAKGLSPL